VCKANIHGRKIFTVTHPAAHFDWFCHPFIASSLLPLLYIGFSTLSSSMLTSLPEKWHAETSNFYLSIWEMIVTLDDVVCLLHIPIVGKMMPHEEMVPEELGVQLITRMLGIFYAHTIEECEK